MFMFEKFSLYLPVFNIHKKVMQLFAFTRLTSVFGVRSVYLSLHY